MWKCDVGYTYMRTAKAQIRLRIRAVWSVPSLSANRIISNYRIYIWRSKARIILSTREGWSQKAHFAHARRYFFASHCSYAEHAIAHIALDKQCVQINIGQAFIWIHCSFLLMQKPNLAESTVFRSPSRKHDPAQIPILSSKAGVYRGIHYFSYFCSKT